jgi:hypothetical protein
MRSSGGSRGSGTIVVDITGVRRASGMVGDAGQALGALGRRISSHPVPEMPAGVAAEVMAAIGEVSATLGTIPQALIDIAQELRVRAFWAEIADQLTAGHDLGGAALTEFKAAYASGLLTRYAEPWQAELAKGYAQKVHDREHPGGLSGFFHDAGEFFSGAWESIKDPAVMIYHLTPLSGDDWAKNWGDLGQSLETAVTHPVAFGKAIANLDALHERGFSYWLGNLAPAVAATLLSGGAAAAVRGADGAVALDRVAEGATAAERVAAEASDASRAEELATIGAQADRHGITRPFEDQPLYRIYGRTEDMLEPRTGALPFGESWTPIDPATMANPRSELGLPDFNHGRMVISGKLRDPSAIKEIRPALRLDGNPGGAPEYVIKHSHRAVEVIEVKGVNPEF